MNLVHLTCESCGAALDATDAPTVFQCTHCGARFAFPPESKSGGAEEMSEEAAEIKRQIDTLDDGYRKKLIHYHELSRAHPMRYVWFHESGAQSEYADYLAQRARLVQLYRAL